MARVFFLHVFLQTCSKNRRFCHFPFLFEPGHFRIFFWTVLVGMSEKPCGIGIFHSDKTATNDLYGNESSFLSKDSKSGSPSGLVGSNPTLSAISEVFAATKTSLLLYLYYTKNGTYDKMAQYYSGYEKPLRDDGNIMTTALSFSVNCTKKRLKLMFWEKPGTVMYYQW